MNAPEMNQTSPVVSKRKASWDGIRLEHFRFREGELPEHNHREHLITFPLGASCNGEIRTESGFYARAESEQSVCVIPSGQNFSARLLAMRNSSPSILILLSSCVRQARRTREASKSSKDFHRTTLL